ncbi:MAG: hypothetical protein Q7K29_04760 [Thermoleophilia bacterium]|nr:hypothetical protein [Thermoleophilia bacterium]
MEKQSALTNSPLTSRVLVVCSKAPGPDGAPGDRCWLLAEALASAHDVILALPRVTQLFHEDFAVVYYNARNVGLVAHDSDVVVCDSEALESHARLVEAGKPVAVDVAGIDAMTDALAAADFYICQSGEERGRWLQYLKDAGRVNPHTLDGDSDLRNLIDIVRPGSEIQPLLDYCAVPRFARDRGTRYSSAVIPAAPVKPGGIAHYWRRMRHLFRNGGWRAVWSRGGAVIKRRISGRRKNS